MMKWAGICIAAVMTVFVATDFGVTQVRAADAFGDCQAKAKGQSDLRECLDGMKQRTGSELKAAYDNAMASMKSVEPAADGTEAASSLESSQVAFALYQQQHCRLLAMQAGGGETGEMVGTGCWIKMARARIDQLNSLAESDMEASQLKSVTWLAVDIGGKGVAKGVNSTFTVTEDGAVAGNAGCNRYFGKTEIRGDRIDIGPLGSTRMACVEPAASEQEMRFLSVLQNAKTFRIENDVLNMADESGKDVLRFRKAPKTANYE
jgi:heat shock protein HslJ